MNRINSHAEQQCFDVRLHNQLQFDIETTISEAPKAAMVRTITRTAKQGDTVLSAAALQQTIPSLFGNRQKPQLHIAAWPW